MRVNAEPEGSRVTMVSNLALGDYEAYRRGDRFYVKIPTSEFATAQPNFRGKGFDDLQVQKNGDSVVISFKLQPGASARVDQQFNRLQVVFATFSGASKSRGLAAGLPPESSNTRGFASPNAEDRSSQPNRALDVFVPSSIGGGGVKDIREQGAAKQTGIDTAGSSVPLSDENRSRSDSRATEQRTPSVPAVEKDTGSSFGHWLSLQWRFAGMLLLSLLAAVLAIGAMLWRKLGAFLADSPWKGEKVGSTRRTTVDEEFDSVDSSSRTLLETIRRKTAQQHTEVIAGTALALPLTSAQSATQEKLVEPAMAESISISPEVKEVREEPPFSDAPQFERTDREIRKLLAQQEYDANLVDAHDKSVYRVVEKPVEDGSRLEASDAFIQFMDTLERHDSPSNGQAPVAPPPSDLTSVTLPENKSSISDEEAQLLLEEQELRRAAKDLELRRIAAEAARQLAESEARLKAEREAHVRAGIEARIRAENEARRRAEEKAARIKSEDEARTRAEQAGRIRAEEEARARADQEARFRLEAEALRRAAEELARKRADAEIARKRVEEERSRQAEEEARSLLPQERPYDSDEEVRRQVELEMRQLAEDEARHLAVQDVQEQGQNEAQHPALEELRRLSEQESLRPGEEERLLREADQGRRLEEQRLRIEQETLIRAAEEVARRRREIDEGRRIAAEEARLLIASQDRIRAEEEQRKRVVERPQLEVEARHRAEEERFEEARRRAIEEQRRIEEQSLHPAEEEEQRLSELEAVRQKAQDHARQRAGIEQRIRSEIQALHKAEEEQRQRIEIETRRRAEAEARLREEQARGRLEEQARLEVEEATRLAKASRIVGEQEGRPGGDLELRGRADDERPRAAEESRLRAEAEAWMRTETEAQAKAESATRSKETTDPTPMLQTQLPREGAVKGHGPVEEPAKGIDLVRPRNRPALVRENSGISPELLNKLSSLSSGQRAAALNELGRLGGEEAFSFISSSFDDQSLDVRNAAARALYDLQSDRAATFTRALREGTPERRRKIGASLAASGLASNAIANLTGESRERTYDAFSLLFLMAKAGEVQPLMRAIEDYPNIEVRLAVIKLLALSGQPEIVPAFRRLAVRGSLPPEVRGAMMEAIYQISSPTRENPAA